MIKKTERQIELAMAFWIGVGLMSIINVVKLLYTASAILYSWIMFGVSIIFIFICIILIKREK